MKINLGGGFKRIEGFLNVDADPLTKPDTVVNIETDKWPYSDNTVDEVRAHHILEHIGDGFFHVMQELYRVCKDGAIIDIAVPHHRSEVWYGDVTHRRFITIDNLRQFSKKENAWHVNQWHSSSGFGVRYNVDFEIIEYEFIPNENWRTRFATMTPAEITEVSTNFINVYYETRIKLLTVK